ncbi:permease [Tindallia californiensis]|uniref:Permease n=1 Tax=Tindallia californiensis TaxID=159292 RepID=A0A1H3JXV1_9FIRM|nr:permease [Tindallia californiensis]SDY44756.1 hypothetical protein SAMN05192546_102152 [Tindallia californiensis]
MTLFLEMLYGGLESLSNYVTARRLMSLTIAFFLSGAISQFMSQGAILKYFGPKADKKLAYVVASVSGAILTVCSCSVLPMFASIRKKGAGIGPAITFLFSGPAINVLAISMTFSALGLQIGWVRVVGAVILSLIIGIIMYALYNKSEIVDENEAMFSIDDENGRTMKQNIFFFLNLLAILISGVRNPIPTLFLLAALIFQLKKNFTVNEIKEWCLETGNLAKKIAPLFLVGIFAAGVIQTILPHEFVAQHVGDNTYTSNLVASVFAAFMYFSTLTEIPIVEAFMEMDMAKGPATALLLAGPSLSLPNMIVISKVLGKKKTGTYIVLVMVFSALVGLLAGHYIY